VLVDPTPFVGLDRVADAVEHLLAGRNTGKVVVRLP
jgi:NADPH-dependent curcumin reductase CurA